MKFSDYLKHIDETKAQYANRTGIPYPTVWRIYNEKFTPRLKTALKIQEDSGGLVALQDLSISTSE